MGVGDVAELAGRFFNLLGRRLELLGLLARLDAHRHQRAGDLQFHGVQQLREQLEGLALVFLLGVLLGIAAQVNALAQVVQRGQVLAPVGVHALQQHHAHKRGELLLAHDVKFGLEQVVGRCQHLLQDVFIGDGLGALNQLGQGQLQGPFIAQGSLQPGQVPLLFQRLLGHVQAHQLRERAVAQVANGLLERLGFQNLVALLVHDLALVVGNVVVLQQLLAHIEVARFHLALRTFDRTGDDARLDGLAFGHLQPVHDGAHAVARKDAHQGVVQREVKARRARVALTARTAPQLVVDAPAFMPLGGDDAQAPFGLDLLMQALPLAVQGGDALGLHRIGQRIVGLDELHLLFHIAAQHDVRAAAGHVGGNGDHAGAPRLGHDLSLLGVLLGVEHLVGEIRLLKQVAEDLAVFNRGGAHQHRLATAVAVADVLDDRVVLFVGGLVDQVVLVAANRGLVGGNDHRLQPIDLLELVGLGVGRAGHARELAVHAEVVLEGDRGHRLVFRLNGHALLGLHRLVQAIAPAAAAHQTARELVHDHHLAVLHHIVLVPVVEMVCPQRGVHMVHQGHVGGVVQAGAFGQQAGFGQQLLGVLVASIGQHHLVRLLIHREIARLDHALARTRIGFADLAFQGRHHRVDPHVQVGVVLSLPADDQRRARFIDQDGVHFVDDAVVQRALHPVSRLIDHVVAQVVKPKLVVGAVGDIGVVGGLLGLALHARHVHTHAQSQEVVQAPHPLGVAPGQVVVDGHHVHALARQGIEHHRQGGHQRFAFAGAHLGDLAAVQGHATDELHIEVPHLQRALAGLAGQRKGLGQDFIERGAARHARAQFVGEAAQRRIVHLFEAGLQGIDLLHHLAVLLEQAVVSTAKNRGQELGQHAL